MKMNRKEEKTKGTGKICSALPAELDSFLKETVSYRIEAILEARCPYGEDFEDLERLILNLAGKEKEREAEALLERAISRTAVEQQAIYEEAFLDGLRLGSRAHCRRGGEIWG